MTAFGGALTDPTRIMGSRIGAYLIDFVLAAAVVAVVFVLFGARHFEEVPASSPAAAQAICDDIEQQLTGDRACFAWGNTARVANADDVSAVEFQFYASAIGFGLLNYVVLSAIAGGTIGKLIFGLRVVTATGQRAGIGRNLVRWLFLIVDQFCCYVLPGLLVAFKAKGHRRIGDMVGGTYVVHRSAEGRLLHIPGHLHVKNRDPYAVPGAARPTAAPAPGAPSGIDGPVFDPARNTYVRYDQTSGAWFQWDDARQAWVPVSQ